MQGDTNGLTEVMAPHIIIITIIIIIIITYMLMRNIVVANMMTAPMRAPAVTATETRSWCNLNATQHSLSSVTFCLQKVLHQIIFFFWVRVNPLFKAYRLRQTSITVLVIAFRSQLNCLFFVQGYVSYWNHTQYNKAI